MPIPHFLTKAYLSLEKFDPHSVAQAFYIVMKEFDVKTLSMAPLIQDNAPRPGLQEEEIQDATRDSTSEGDNLLADQGNK